MLHINKNTEYIRVKISQPLFNAVRENLPVLDAFSVSELAGRVLTDYMKTHHISNVRKNVRHFNSANPEYRKLKSRKPGEANSAGVKGEK